MLGNLKKAADAATQALAQVVQGGAGGDQTWTQTLQASNEQVQAEQQLKEAYDKTVQGRNGTSVRVPREWYPTPLFPSTFKPGGCQHTQAYTRTGTGTHRHEAMLRTEMFNCLGVAAYAYAAYASCCA